MAINRKTLSSFPFLLREEGLLSTNKTFELSLSIREEQPRNQNRQGG